MLPKLNAGIKQRWSLVVKRAHATADMQPRQQDRQLWIPTIRVPGGRSRWQSSPNGRQRENGDHLSLCLSSSVISTSSFGWFRVLLLLCMTPCAEDLLRTLLRRRMIL